MAGTLVSYLPFTRSVTEDLSGKEWTVTGNPQIVYRPDFSVPVAKFEADEYLSLENITAGGKNHWLMDFWIYIPQSSSNSEIIRIGGDDWLFSLLDVLNSGKLRIWENTKEDLTGDYSYYEVTNETVFNKWINIKLSYNQTYNGFYGLANIGIHVSDGTKYLISGLHLHEMSYETKIGRLRLAKSTQMFISQFRFYTRSNTYYIKDFMPNPPTDSGNVNIYLPTRQSFAWNEFQVHDTVNFDYSDNINYTTNNKSMQWYYKNIGTADGLLVDGTSLTNVSPLKSITSKAFYQTNRQRCFDTQASKEIYMLFDIYFDGKNRWRAYEESSTNGTTGITAQTSGVLNIFSNNTNIGVSIPLTINKLETYLLHMRSDTISGYIEVYKDGELKYTYIGNVNNGDDFSNLNLQSDGSGTIFSNIVISNQPVYDYDRWTGDYKHIQRTLTNETWIPAKCFKAGLVYPQNNIIETSDTDSWTAHGTLTISETNAISGKALQITASGQYISLDNVLTLGGQDFTIRGHAYMSSFTTSYGRLFEFKVDDSSNDRLELTRYNGSGSLQFFYRINDSDKINKQLGSGLTNSQFDFEIDYTHADTTYRVFINGALSLTATAAVPRTTFQFPWIGRGKYDGGQWIGSIDEFQIYDGVALHTANFTPPTAEDYAIAKEQLLRGDVNKYLVSWLSFDKSKGKSYSNIAFTGQNNSYAALPIDVLAGATTFTIEIELSTTSTKTSSNPWQNGHILGREISGNWQDDFGFYINAGKVCFWAEPKSGSSAANFKNAKTLSNSVINDGLIHKLAVVSSNGAIDLYCDGVNIGHTDGTNAKISTDKSILLACNSDSASYLQMDLYEARFWNVARTQEQIFTDIDGTETGLQAWYKPSAEGLLDYSGNNRHATLYNAAYNTKQYLTIEPNSSPLQDLCNNTWTKSGTMPSTTTINEVNGRAVQFGNGYLYTTPPELKSNDFTIDWWEYIPSTINTSTNEIVAIDGTDGTNTTCLSIYHSSTTPLFALGPGAKLGLIYTGKSIGTKIRDQWVHRAVVRYNDKIYAFENGQLYTSFDIDPDMYIDITGSSLFVGGYKRESRLFPGMLSEMRIHVGTALWTINFTPPTQEDYFETYWYFNKPAPILNTNYDILRYLTNNSKIWKYINPGYNDISPFTYTNSSVTPVQVDDDYTDMQLSGNINLNIDIYQELCIKFNIYIGNFLGTVFSFPYGKGTISISISESESSTSYLAKIIHERNEENPIGIQLSPETSYSDYELGKVNEEISFIIYIKSDASNKGEIIINSSAWVDTDDNRRAAIFPSTGRFHLYNANINEGNALLKILNSQGIYNLIVSNQQLTFDDMVCQNINSTQLIVSNDEDWRREKYYWNTYLPFVDSVTKDFSGNTWTLHDTLVIQDNACYFDGSGYLWIVSTLDASKPFTISFYMSATSNNTGGEPCIFQFYWELKSFSILQDRHLIECKITSSGNLVFSGDFLYDHKSFALSTSFSILDGKMHYVECIYTGSKCLFFVDGMLIGTASHVFKSNDNEYGLTLGKNIFTGYLKDFRIYQDYVLHTENFTPSPIMGNRLFYDKSEETMKFESFADIITKSAYLNILTTSNLLFWAVPRGISSDDRVIKLRGTQPSLFTDSIIDRIIVYKKNRGSVISPDLNAKFAGPDLSIKMNQWSCDQYKYWFDKITFIIWFAKSRTVAENNDDRAMIDLDLHNENIAVQHPVRLRICSDKIQIQLNYDTIEAEIPIEYLNVYHLAITAVSNNISIYLNGKVVWHSDAIENNKYTISIFDYDFLLETFGFGLYNTNIFENNNINIGSIVGSLPSYRIPIQIYKQQSSAIAVYHNDNVFYNKLVLPTDENASKIRVYHNNTIYALSK